MGSFLNDAPKIQKILDRQGEVVFPRDDYLITESINIPTGTGVTWAEGSRLRDYFRIHPNNGNRL